MASVLIASPTSNEHGRGSTVATHGRRKRVSQRGSLVRRVNSAAERRLLHLAEGRSADELAQVEAGDRRRAG